MAVSVCRRNPVSGDQFMANSFGIQFCFHFAMAGHYREILDDLRDGLEEQRNEGHDDQRLDRRTGQPTRIG